ncbi:MAG TPA: hypothetical protein VFJ57_08445 [Solirubrobacterales bacterium]|nr:hypothetical protein [Solirubrobacterales bacterium]
MEPYVGLGHFTEDFADRFFGRDTECSLIIGNLRAARLTLLYAESGVGKSSLLRAGVVARLHGFAEHDVEVRGRPRLVPVVFSTWSEAPVAGLVRALAEAVRPYLDDGAELDLPEDDLERALELASAALEATLLVVLDQFEEYFLYPEPGPEEEHVAAQIARCVHRRDLRANFLISIREDSYARLGDLFRGKLTNVYANFLHLDFLGRDGARESIEKPIERVNELSANGHRYELEPALVEAVLDEVGRGRIEADEDGQRGGDEDRDEIETTYLQLVMRRLWAEETGAGSERLRLATLEQLGGSQAVITSHLDRAMDDETDGASLSPGQRLVAASIFHFLVTSGGTKIALTAQDLADLSGRPRAEIEPVLRHLSSPALHILRPVVSENGQGEPRFEIFHDALARPIVEWRTRVEETERDARLERERAEKERAQRAAAEAEEREERERRRKRLALVVLGSAVVALLAIAIYLAIDQRERADQTEADTQSLRVLQRVSELSASPSFGVAMTAVADVEAYRLSPIAEARSRALAMLQDDPSLGRVATGHTDSVQTVAYLPGSNRLASGGDDRAVRLWDSSGREFGPPLKLPKPVVGLAVSKPREGRWIVAAGLRDGSIELWSVSRDGTHRWLHRIYAGDARSVEGLAFNPRWPTMLAVGAPGNRVTLWDLKHPRSPVKIDGRDTGGEITDLTFDSGGTGLLVASEQGQRWAVGPSGFTAPNPEVLVRESVWSVAAAADGSYAFVTAEGIDLRDVIRRRTLHLPVAEFVESVAFARRGAVLVAGGDDFNVTTWDVASGRPFGPVRVAHLPVEDVAVSPDGRTIAAARGDDLVSLWALAPEHELATTVGALRPRNDASEVEGLATGAEGRFAVAAGAAGTSLWRLPGKAGAGSSPRPWAQIPGESHAVAYRGNLLAVARGKSFVLWSTGPSCPRMPAHPCRLGAPTAPFSDGKVHSLSLAKYGDELLLASAGIRGGRGVVNLWDVSDTAKTGEVIHSSTREPHHKADTEDARTVINQIAFSRQNPLLAVAAMDGKTRVWDVSDPEDPEGIHIAHARGNGDQAVFAVAFSQDGKLLASGGRDEQVVLWEVTWQPGGETNVDLTANPLFQTQVVRSIAFSPNGETLAAGGSEGRTCVYEVSNRTRIGSASCLLGHIPLYSGGAAIADVRYGHPVRGAPPLLTAGPEQPIIAWDPILWNLNDVDWINEEVTEDACALAGRNLNADEWDAIFGATKFESDHPHETCPESSDGAD